MITLTGNTALQIYAQSGIAEEASGSPSCNGLDWGHGRAKDLLDLEELGSPPPQNIPSTSSSTIGTTASNQTK